MAGTNVTVYVDHDDQIKAYDSMIIRVEPAKDRRPLAIVDDWMLGFMGTPAEIVTGVDHLIEALQEIRSHALTEAARKAARAAAIEIMDTDRINIIR